MSVKYAFAGRCSTEDQQDPVASRNWQFTRANALIESHGEIVTEFFDIGQSAPSHGSADRKRLSSWSP